MNFYLGTCLIFHNDTAQKIIEKKTLAIKIWLRYFTNTRYLRVQSIEALMIHIHIHILSDNGRFFATAYKEVIKVSKGMLTNPLFLPFR